MSWTQRFGGSLGRFSPFTRSPPQGPTKVSDADFSYITADDLRRHQAESMGQQSEADYGPPRDTDVLILRNKRKETAVHFPAYSIAKGELTIGKVREQAAKTLQSDPRRIKLLYKGKNLKDDSRLASQEGLQDGAELMLAIAEGVASPSDSEESDDEFADINGSGTADGEAKRKRNRGKKSKRRNKREQSGTSTPQLGVPNGDQTSRTQSPRPPPSPATPLDKLNALHAKLQEFVPSCEAYLASPPSEPAKKDFEHKRLTESILTQVLLKTDGVETEGDEEARSRRKALVKETQGWLNKLDAARNA
ncbi:Putative Ubiquitin-like domain, BAG domain, Ubiquitin-like domain superfamily [Septoria linicola]|uniref:Ubiquitin-like domain, BAG domain, Ubiquitin-like domain superfamily n=1 Tax=Septoria linicola TaxID=215465 RepID=A0A9Q9AMC8_9PEZI|nr:putative Ubiquitin-like domain, BAG domain, Ubiquitin-like domain superfamily [Septoria linicola]USW48657.1 Putative Ubiquitin-like domain, BAG domain, Ubiquitin-like domain superfamily [Septoria linicola]